MPVDQKAVKGSDRRTSSELWCQLLPLRLGQRKLIIRYNKFHPKNLRKALDEGAEKLRVAESNNLPLKKRPPLALGGITRKDSPAKGVSPEPGAELFN